MRSMFKSVALAVLSTATLAAHAQQKINPQTQVKWPANCTASGVVAYNALTNGCIPVGSAVAPIVYSGQWDATKTYPMNTAVAYGGDQYISLQDGNKAQAPSTSGAYWAFLIGGGSTPGPPGPTGPAGPPGAIQTTTVLSYQQAINTGQVHDPNSVPSVAEPLNALGVSTTRASAINKTIVVYGSSTAQGYFASSYATSWAGLFTAAMQAKGYAVHNTSVGGISSAQLVTNFYTDVAPFRPAFVILSENLANDTYDIAAHHANYLKLIQMCRQIGAIPVVLSQYGNNNYTAQQYQVVQDDLRFWDSRNVPVIDVLSATADPANNGHWITGMSGDGSGLHPSDLGHAAMADAIPLTMFDALLTGSPTRIPASSRTAWMMPTGTAGVVPISVSADRPFNSFTFASWIYVQNNAQTQVFFSGVGTGDFQTPNNSRLRLANGGQITYFPCANTSISQSTTAYTPGWNHVAVAYNHGKNLYTVYVNGVALGAPFAGCGLSSVTTFCILNNLINQQFPAQNSGIAATYLYRVPLTADAIYSIYRGSVPTGGLEWASAFDSGAKASSGLTPLPANIATTTNSPTVTPATFNAGVFTSPY